MRSVHTYTVNNGTLGTFIVQTRNIGIYIIGIVLCLSAMVVQAALHICQKCGYENDPGATICVHCKAPFPVQEQPAASAEDASEEVTEGAPDEYAPLELVYAEVAEGRTWMQKEAYELARCFFLNALALEGLTDPTEHNTRSEQLLRMVAQAESAARTVRKPCPRCGGSGRHTLKIAGLDSSNRGSDFGLGERLSTDDAAGITCKKCGGDGLVYAAGTIAEMTFARSKAQSAYGKYQQARKYEMLGAVWVPLRFADALTVRQKARLMRSIVLPCASCAGFGRKDCKHCDGVGRMDCPNRACNKGRVPVEQSNRNIQRLEGSSTKVCEVCGGLETVPCTHCDEQGSIVCADCNGSGDAEICSRCTGRGYVLCNRCKGSKMYRGEACANCRGEGYVLCPSCKGRGRRN